MNLNLNTNITRANQTVSEVGAVNPPVNTVAPSITGTQRVGQMLSGSDGTWTNDEADSFTYEWLRDDVVIGGATANTYTLVSADYNTIIKFRVTNTNTGGATTATSAGTSAILPVVPVNTVLPVVTSAGEFKTGYQLSCTTGTWTSQGTPTYTYQWQKDGVNISGATNSTYTPVDADAGTITCEVIATNLGGAGTMAESVGVSVTVLTDLEVLISFQNGADLIPVPVSGVYWNQITTPAAGVKLSNLVTSSNGATTIDFEHLIDPTNGGSLSLDTGTSSQVTVDGTVMAGKANEDSIFSALAIVEQLCFSFNELPFGYTWSVMMSGYRNSGSNRTGRAKIEDTITPSQTFSYQEWDCLSNATFTNRFNETGILRDNNNKIQIRFGKTSHNGHIQWIRLKATRTVIP